MKRSPLRRTGGLRREARLRAGRRRRRETDTELAALFRRTVLGREARCIGARYSDVPCETVGSGYDPMHIIPAQLLRRHGYTEAVVYDPRNGIAGCRKHHRRNDDGLERIPADLIPQPALDFAHENGLMHVLERLYGAPTELRELSEAEKDDNTIGRFLFPDD